jgi:NAD(P)-dependent dehydrogenase (short-subunit alcohol dehydrogenase family)
MAVASFRRSHLLFGVPVDLRALVRASAASRAAADQDRRALRRRRQHRHHARELEPRLSTKIIVENRAGAGSLLGSDAVAKGTRDGSVLFTTASRGVGSVLDTSRELCRRNMSVILDGSFNTCQAFARAAPAAARGGSIVNVSSQGGTEGVPRRLSYVSAKHGVIGLKRGAALELAPLGIRVNAVAPGMIRTPMTEGMFADPENAGRIRAARPIGREGGPKRSPQ